MNPLTISGNLVDVLNREIFPGTITVEDGKITSIIRNDKLLEAQYILPGFIDAHIHIESSMLIPSEFARIAVTHGTVATVSDPHEIGNVLGIEGIRYMIQNGKKVPFHFYFGASPCVPATAFETAGAKIGVKELSSLFTEDGLHYLSEMMNFPGVLSEDPEVMAKIRLAQSLNKPIDGHAPGLRGEDARRYIAAGISTDHECFTLEEALDKIRYGMKIIIREGSAAKNFEALHPLFKSHCDKLMFCSDDKHPDELVKGHINLLVKRALKKGYPVMDILRSACLNPVEHYNLDVGVLRVGDSADFIVVDNLENFDILKTYIKGQLVASNVTTFIPSVTEDNLNHFETNFNEPTDFKLTPEGSQIRVIEALEGQLITNELSEIAKIENDNIVSDTDRDNLKLAVVNRYGKAAPAIGFIRNFGLKKGAIASCVAHDSHNIIAVGTSDEDICRAINVIMENKGGIAAVDGKDTVALALPVAGIMSANDGYEIAENYSKVDAKAKELGTKLKAPFMTLSFMALLVIPSLKLSDKGLFNGVSFAFTDTNIKDEEKK